MGLANPKPHLQFFRPALPTDRSQQTRQPLNRVEISIQRHKIGIKRVSKPIFLIEADPPFSSNEGSLDTAAAASLGIDEEIEAPSS